MGEDTANNDENNKDGNKNANGNGFNENQDNQASEELKLRKLQIDNDRKKSTYWKYTKSPGPSRGKHYHPLIATRLDPPHSASRIVLVCTLLNITSKFFKRGKN